MSFRIIDVSSGPWYLSKERGFLNLRNSKNENESRIPLSDILALVGSHRALSYSQALLVELSERNIPVIFCDQRYCPSTFLWPVSTHHLQAKHLDSQIGMSLPRKKNAWKLIIQYKLLAQHLLLINLGHDSIGLDVLSARVRSGDSSNYEALGAAKYWKCFMGKDFVRDQQAENENIFFNYGYTILRASVAKATMAAGLNPGVPVHHKNQTNAMRLIDDLMEPFRPWIDQKVHELLEAKHRELDKNTKHALAALFFEKDFFIKTNTNLNQLIQRFAFSYAKYCLEPSIALEAPFSSENE